MHKFVLVMAIVLGSFSIVSRAQEGEVEEERPTDDQDVPVAQKQIEPPVKPADEQPVQDSQAQTPSQTQETTAPVETATTPQTGVLQMTDVSGALKSPDQISSVSAGDLRSYLANNTDQALSSITSAVLVAMTPEQQQMFNQIGQEILDGTRTVRRNALETMLTTTAEGMVATMATGTTQEQAALAQLQLTMARAYNHQVDTQELRSEERLRKTTFDTFDQLTDQLQPSQSMVQNVATSLRAASTIADAGTFIDQLNNYSIMLRQALARASEPLQLLREATAQTTTTQISPEVQNIRALPSSDGTFFASYPEALMTDLGADRARGVLADLEGKGQIASIEDVVTGLYAALGLPDGSPITEENERKIWQGVTDNESQIIVERLIEVLKDPTLKALLDSYIITKKQVDTATLLPQERDQALAQFGTGKLSPQEDKQLDATQQALTNFQSAVKQRADSFNRTQAEAFYTTIQALESGLVKVTQLTQTTPSSSLIDRVLTSIKKMLSGLVPWWFDHNRFVATEPRPEYYYSIRRELLQQVQDFEGKMRQVANSGPDLRGLTTSLSSLMRSSGQVKLVPEYLALRDTLQKIGMPPDAVDEEISSILERIKTLAAR